jgi:predicted nucleic acid-binding protein
VLVCFQRLKPDDAAISIITWGELLYGAEKNRQCKKAVQLLEEFRTFVPVSRLPENAGKTYGPSWHHRSPKAKLSAKMIYGSPHTLERRPLR